MHGCSELEGPTDGRLGFGMAGDGVGEVPAVEDQTQRLRGVKEQLVVPA